MASAPATMLTGPASEHVYRLVPAFEVGPGTTDNVIAFEVAGEPVVQPSPETILAEITSPLLRVVEE